MAKIIKETAKIEKTIPMTPDTPKTEKPVVIDTTPPPVATPTTKIYTTRSFEIYQTLTNDNYLKSFINDFFKHYFNLGFIELNTLLNTENSLPFLAAPLDELLQIYLLGFKTTTAKSSKFDKLDNLRNLTYQLRLLYPFKTMIRQNHTLVFETTDKKYFIGNAYKLYFVSKETL